ncbi:AI-2E family transporter [Deinococcus sp. SDU3-2]|uniref:AI-2E family transporter n=1 Tax=Deinococcus terrestris TaxID=2651870 RepID=A0A7X1NW37_9DEIO|nr:AI-2E family transporter [Deinococcus terrestris]MPY66878.1 AI-2E family transporter [Deinococcus terrestris]
MRGVISPPKPPTAFAYAWRSPWIRLLVFGLAAYLLYRMAGEVSTIIWNVLIAFLIAYLANPLLTWLERGRVSRGLGVFFVLLLFVALFALAGALLVTVSAQLIDLLARLPDQIGQLGIVIDRLFGWLGDRGIGNLADARERITEAVQTYVENLGNNLIPILQNALNSTGTVFRQLVSIGGVVGQIVIILLLSIYLMLDYSRVNASLLRAFPRPWQPRVLELSSLVSTAVGGYVRGQLVIATFIGVFVWLGLTIIGIPSAAAIGFLAGAFNIVPYLGPVIGATPALLLALPFGWVKMLLVVVIFVLANQIESNVLSPYVLGRTTDLHPVTVLVAILIGASLLGFVGALLAVPIVALGKLLLDKYYYPSRVYTEGP